MKPLSSPKRYAESGEFSSSSREVVAADVRTRHVVHMYEGSAELAAAVAGFLAGSLAYGGAALVIATPEHAEGVCQRLSELGHDVEALRREGQLTLLDAQDTLERLLVAGKPNWQRVLDVVGGALAEATRKSEQGRVAVYGEMVDVLWSAGQHDAALRLEDLWNRLQKTSHFDLLCGYSKAAFHQAADDSRVHCLHTHSLAYAAKSKGKIVLALAEVPEFEFGLRKSLRELWVKEDDLRDNEMQLQTMLDALPALLSYVDRDQRYRLVNQGYERWFGSPAKETVGKHMREVLGAEAYERILPQVESVLRGEPVKYEASIPYAKGRHRFIEATYVPHIDADGDVRGFVALVADISNRKALEAAREASSIRTERLMKVAAALADAITPDEVYSAVVSQTAEALGASSSGLWLRDSMDTELVRLMCSHGYNPAGQAALQTLRLDAEKRLPVLDTIAAGKPIWIASQDDLLQTYPHLRALVTAERSYRIACLPIMVNGATLGAITFTFDDAPPIDSEGKSLLLLVARHSGQALERLRLYETEKRGRAEIEAAASRLALLSQASKVFSESGPELSTGLQRVVELLTLDHADGCAILLISEDRETLHMSTSHHRDPEAHAMLQALLISKPLRVGEGFAGSVAATGKSLLLSALDATSGNVALEESYQAWLTKYPIGSLVVVPLRVRGSTIGVLSALRAGDRWSFSSEDQRLFEELAERAALAIEACRLMSDTKQAQLRAELLYDMAAAVIRASRIEEVFEAALTAIQRALGASRAAILSFDENSLMRFRSWHDLSDEYRCKVEGHSPWSKDTENAQAIVVPDVTTDPAMLPYSEVFRAENIRALAFIPLQSGGQLLGKFMVYYAEPRSLSTSEIEIAQAIANHVAAAMSHFGALTELQETVRFNEMFTGILGHDLRNPLGAIMTSARLAIIRDVEGGLGKPLARILTSGGRMARMIDQLLDFTRVRIGSGIPLQGAASDLLDVLRQVTDELETANPSSSFKLVHRGGSTIGTWDSDRLSQVFSNLLANAARHGTGENGITISVTDEGSDSVGVEVHNFGTIDPEVLPRIFEPMVSQGRQGVSSTSEGLGLGLYITQQIVKAHGGKIEVQSSPDVGTTFIVTLPRRLQ